MYSFNLSVTGSMQHKVNFLSGVKLIWIESFLFLAPKFCLKISENESNFLQR